MLQVARLAPRLLGESAELVRDFVLSQLHDEGGFVDREGKPDLYYTVFGLDALIALQADLPEDRVGRYVETFGSGSDLDLVHLACLARSHGALRGLSSAVEVRREIAARIESFRSADGAFHNSAGRETGTVYGYFLALGVYQDLGFEELAAAEVDGLLTFLDRMSTPDGGHANEPTMTVGATPPTAAAVTMMRSMGVAVPESAVAFLESLHVPAGGFRALAGAPMPDLLSTATALHALSGVQRSLDAVREPCLDFVDSLWTNRGAFYGHWADETVDCEYTFYGLLALGHLS
jgi:prenyltransferase beta subunit